MDDRVVLDRDPPVDIAALDVSKCRSSDLGAVLARERHGPTRPCRRARGAPPCGARRSSPRRAARPERGRATSSARPRSMSGRWKSIHAASTQSNAPSANGRLAASPTCASTPRSRASSTIRGETSTMTTSQPTSSRIRAASSPGAAADLEHPPRIALRHGMRTRRRAGRGLRRSRRASAVASRFASLAYWRATASGSLSPHFSTIVRPGAPFPGCFAPSQAHTVAPTSANSPSSWIRPAAFLPAA